jgi:hypothetical protein
MADTATLLRSGSGYVVAAERGPDADVLTVSAPDGRLCLSIQLRPEGPLVEVQSQSLRLVSTGELRLDCERLTINAERQTSIQTGELRQVVGGDVSLRAGGVIDTEGHAQHLRARLGDLELTANDDVSLDGERVLLNTPKSAAPAWPGLLPARK